MAKRKSTPVASSTKRGSGGPAPRTQSVLFEEREMPFIRLRGFWLACAGFRPADTLKVRIWKGRIVVSRR